MGRAGLDLYADPPGTRMEEALRFTAALGGSAANIAAALVRQGCKAALVSAVSADAVGRHVLRQLDAYGINRHHVAEMAGEARNSLALVETRAEACQSVIYRNGAADFELNADQARAVDYASHDALIFTGTNLAREPSRSATLSALAMARKAGASVIMDIDHRPYSWASAAEAAQLYGIAAEASDIVVGNDEEFAILARGGDGLATARALAANQNRIAVYKMGPKGSVTISGSDEFTTPIFAVQALKPTGAGDAFMGGFISSLANGSDLRGAVRRGSATAAIVVTRVGCAPAMPTTAELDSFLKGQ